MRGIESNETLSVGLGHFGSLTQTHLFNHLDETVRQVEASENNSLSERSCVTCGPLYREVREGFFEPRLCLAVQSTDLLPYGTDSEGSKRHPYQVWADTRDGPRPNFDFGETTHSFVDIADFNLPLSQVAKIKAMRPVWENLEATQDCFRLQLEKADHIALISIAQELQSGVPDWDVPSECTDFFLTETPTTAIVYTTGVTPIYQRSRLASPTQVQGDRCAAKALLCAVREFYDLYGMMRNRTGKCILPIDLAVRFWQNSAPKNHTSFTFQNEVFAIKSVYELSAIAGIAIDAITMPLRDPSAHQAPLTSLGQLTTSFCPIIATTLGLIEHQSKIYDLHEITSFCPLQDPNLMQYPGHNCHLRSTRGQWQHASSWESGTKKEFTFEEPYAVSASAPWADYGSNLLDYCAIMQSPLWLNPHNTSSSRDQAGVADEVGDSFLFGSLRMIDDALRNSDYINRSSREDWLEVKNNILDIVDDLNLRHFVETDSDEDI